MAKPPIKINFPGYPVVGVDFQPGKLLNACIALVEPDNTIKNVTPESYFLLNPSSIDESKTANWVPASVPGQSDPVFQWISSGPRTVTFEALVTKDISKPAEIVPPPEQTPLQKVAGIAQKFLGIKPPTLPKIPVKIPGLPLNQDGSVNATDQNLSIDKYLNFYRSLLYPTYSSGRLVSSPKLVVLYFGRALGNSASGTKISKKDTVWAVTGVKIKITKQLPDLTPMEAIVNFELVEYSRGSKSWSDIYG